MNKQDMDSSQAQNQRTLVDSSHLDHLTGLLNKEGFFAEVKHIVSNAPAGSYAILRWDIDRFRIFNDLFGPASGDDLLKSIGDYYHAHTKDFTGKAFARLSSDHFACCIALQGLDENKVLHYLEDVLSEICPSFRCIVRIGIYPIDEPALDVSLMCDRALLALRSVKGTMAQQIAWYDDALREAETREQEQLSEIISALNQKQFIIFLQPQYDQYTREIIGAEALARWIHPTRGVLSPSAFIPLMEKHGLTHILDKMIWEQAAAFVASITTNTDTLPCVSVNISRQDLYSASLITDLCDTVSKYHIETSQLHLEITETAYMSHPDQSISIVHELHDRGFVVEMDDFGSEYSSLNALKDLPVNMLKLDMNFLSDGINKDSTGGIIVSSVIRMAHWLNLRVIAEGVETKQQADYLKSIGCRYAQGYYYTRPLPIRQFRELLASKTYTHAETDDMSESFYHGIDFWKPESQTAAVFNTLIGASGIFEYYNKTLECVCVNNQYLQTISSAHHDSYRLKDRVLDAVHHDDRALLIEMLEQAKTNNDEHRVEIRYLKPGKSHEQTQIDWISVRARRIACNIDRTLFFAALDNITERKEYEIRLQTENDFYRELIASTCSSCKNLSHMFCAATGQSHEELKKEAQTLHSQDILQVLDTHTSTLQTKLAQAQEELEQQRNNMQLVNDNASACSLIFDIHAREIHYMSGNLLGQYGYHSDEVAHFRKALLKGLIYKPDYEYVVQTIRNAGKQRLPYFTLESRIVKKYGELAWVHADFTFTHDRTGTEVYVCLIMDITQRKKLEHERLENERFIQAVSALSDRIAFRYDITKRHLSTVDPAYCSRYGLPTEYDNLPGRAIDEHLVFPEDAETFRQFFVSIHQEQSRGTARFRLQTQQTNTYRWFEGRFALLSVAAEDAPLAVVSLLDIDDIHEKEITYNRYQSVIVDSIRHNLAYLEVDLSTNTVIKQGGETFRPIDNFEGWSFDDVMRSIAQILVPVKDSTDLPDDTPSRKKLIELAQKGVAVHEKDLHLQLADKTDVWLHAEFQLFNDPFTDHIMTFITARDITEEQTRNKDLLYRAERDGMTGIYNRQTVEKLVSKYLSAPSHNVGLFMLIDLDDLKTINDTLGHAEGDRAIRALVNALRSSFRSNDIIGRAGGDEFIVLLPNIGDTARVESLMHSFRSRLGDMHVGEHNDLPIRCSIGATLVTCGESDFDTAYRQADKALYSIKNNQKNGYALYRPDELNER